MSLPRAEPRCRCAGNGNSSMVRSTLNPTHVAQYLGRKSSNCIAGARARSTLSLVSCPINTLLDPPAKSLAGQGAPTRQRQLKGTGEEAQRRPARKGAAQRVRYLWDRTLVYRFGGAAVMAARS